MLLKEIYDKKWKISKDLKIRECSYTFIGKEEQECHFNILKEGFNSDKSEIYFCCSFQEYITKLQKSEFVTITEVLICKKNKYVLQITGLMINNGLTIRRSIPKTNKEVSKARAEALRTYHDRNRNQKDDTIGKEL